MAARVGLGVGGVRVVAMVVVAAPREAAETMAAARDEVVAAV